MPRGPRFTEGEFREAVAGARSFSEALRALGLRAAGGNFRTMHRYCERWAVPTDHFDQSAVIREHLERRRSAATPLSEVMVEHSTYHRGHLKRRLFAEGIKARCCEQCGQGEMWRGRRMALILDHVNGQADDHRIENLRILCPNCAATLDTHCGRKNTIRRAPRRCPGCGAEFRPRYDTHRFCSRACWWRWPRPPAPRPQQRKVERPPYEQLVAEVRALGWAAAGRRYGVSDNAVRKWIRGYERDRQRAASAAAR